METWIFFYLRRLLLFARLSYYFIPCLRLTKSSTLLSSRFPVSSFHMVIENVDDIFFSKMGTFGTVCAVSAACEISVKVCFLWLPTRYSKNRIFFLKDLHQTTCGLRLEWLGLSVLFQMLFPVMQFESEIDSGLKMIPKIDLNEFKPIF